MRIIDAENDEELAMVRYIVEQSQAWARKHFNADNAATAGLLDAPACYVEFPEPDKMIVQPAMYGHAIGLEFHYQLVLHHNGAFWLGKHPIYTDKYLPKLWVKPEED